MIEETIKRYKRKASGFRARAAEYEDQPEVATAGFIVAALCDEIVQDLEAIALDLETEV